MKILVNYLILIFLTFHLYSPMGNTLEKKLITNKSQTIASKYAERYCSAKDNNFFEGLEKEKTLKYSYFRYIGFNNQEIYLMEMYKPLIYQIRKKCSITRDEEEELNAFFEEKSISEMK